MRLGVSARFALREMRGGLKGFRIFLACLALGVAAIAAVGSLAEAILEGLRQEGQAILGGDVEAEILQREASPEGVAALSKLGRVSHVVEMRAMAKSALSGESTLIQLKAVDGAYPLFGRLSVEGESDLDAALAVRQGRLGALIDGDLKGRLDLAVGDVVSVGDAELEIRGIILKEPDRSLAAMDFGPRVMIALEHVAATGLIRPGSLAAYKYRVALRGNVDPTAAKVTLSEALPDEGWRLRDRDDSSPSVRRFVERIESFLTLVGLTALLVGGVGVGGSVKAYLEGKTATIATLKCLGAPSRVIFETYFFQIRALALLGILIGLAVGSAAPFLLVEFMQGALPVPTRIGLYPAPLAKAAAFGALTAFIFTLWPLARAQALPAAALFRDLVAPQRRWPRAGFLAAGGAAVAVMIGLAIFTAENTAVAGWFVAAAIGAFLLLASVSRGLTRLAKAAGRPRQPHLRIALSNLYRPGAATGTVILSLGLGLTLLVAIASVEGNLSEEIREELPSDAPAFFFLDIQKEQIEDFDALLSTLPGVAEFRRVPTLRGAIRTIAGVPVEDADIAPDARWAVRGDRALTFLSDLPEDNRIKEGAWWPADYSGPPLISFDERLALGMGVGVGDAIGFNILGREIEAAIASTREIDWGNFSLNFAVIFAPGALENAPYSYLGAVRAEPAQEPAIFRALTRSFPNVTTVRVRDVIEQASRILQQIGAAVRAAAAVTLAVGVLVLAGAMAAAQRRHVYESVVLKVLGGTRADVLKTYLLEYLIIGATAATLAMALGSAASWAVVEGLMEMNWVFLPASMAATAILSLAITIGFGLAGTWAALGHKPAAYLRSE